jgi:serine protease
MSYSSKHSIRFNSVRSNSVRFSSIRSNVLAAATVAALSAVCAAPALAGQANLSALRAGGEYGQFIVKYRNGNNAPPSTAVVAASLNEASRAVPVRAGQRLGMKHFRRMALGADVVRADRKLDRDEAESLMRGLAADPNVLYVEPDVMLQLYAVPNDTRYNEQWHYANTAAGAKIAGAWDQSNGSGIVVGVVDSGILAHSDLDGNVLPGYDMVTSTTGGICPGFTAFDCGASDDGDGRDADPTDSSAATTSQHGTHVAGTIAALTNNGAGVAGVAYGAKILPVRAMGRKGSGTLSDILDGITWASGGSVPNAPVNANPADVINLSLGGAQACSQAYQDAINAATARGTVIVAAAGNSNTDVSGNAPANCPNVITVASSDIGGKRAWYSAYGATIDITAPGGETCSPATEFLPLGTSPSGKCTQNHTSQGVLSTVGGGGYGFLQGTSMASPHVAGIVALMQSVSSTPKTTSQLIALLGSTARPIAAADCPGGCGPGLVDAQAAVAAVAGGPGPGNQAPVANFSSSASGLTVAFTDTSSDSDGTIASRSWNFGDGTTSTATNPSKTYAAAGTYTVTLTVTDDDGATHTKTASVTVGTSGVQTYTNGTDVAIPDNNATGVSSSIVVSGRTGNAPANATISVNIVHPYKGDLIVDLIAPDGTVYNIHNRSGGSADNVSGTFSKNLSTEALNGTWRLRAADRAVLDVGRIDTWSITF